MAREILELLLTQPDIAMAREWVVEATRLLKASPQPTWLETQVEQYFALQQLIRDIEAEDSALAPAAHELATFADQRMFTQGLNWGKRHVQLTASRILIRKHEPDKAERSMNPFLDMRTDCIMLAADMQVLCRHHSSSTHAASLDRPYCLELVRSQPNASTDVALLLDMWTEHARNAWLAALQANITRLSMDPLWLKHPRPLLDPAVTTIAHLLRYILLYPSSDSRDCRFRDACRVDASRSLYLQLCVYGQLQQWDAVVELTRPGKVRARACAPEQRESS
ncbi:hypothetical protein DYB32_008449 [Aphanomyces invadans]|uniref:PH domain-containing protein n=1 Tax=Aphanomyces invadans TaxID=157072 RepID=A0A3R6YX97_9STRA|nr:hypothetical protein DYB32_008449 [Aphanomyces invadans]